MKQCQLLFLLMMGWLMGKTQFAYVDTVYDRHRFGAEYSYVSLELSADKFILPCYAADTDIYALHIFCINHQGDTIWDREYNMDSIAGMVINNACFDRHKNIIMSGQIFIDSLDGEQGLLAKADSNGNLEWLKIYPGIHYGLNQGFWGLSSLATPSNEYLLIGQESRDTSINAPFLVVKTDTVGSELARYYYGPPDQDAPLGGGINTSDKGYLLSGMTDEDDSSISGTGTGYNRIFVVKADSAFNEVWETIVPTGRDSNGIFDDGAAYGEIEDTDGYIILGHKPWATNDYDYTYLNEGPRGWQKLWIGKLSKDSGKIMWEKMYGLDTLDYAGFYSITPTPDGNYALCGVYGWDNFYRNVACVYKINHNGDSLWSARFADHDSFNISVNPYTINAIGTAGYMITGYVKLDNNTAPYPWVYTIDSNGYAPPYVPDTITSIGIINRDFVSLKIYLNPSSDYFWVSYQLGTDNNASSAIMVCNALGQTIYQQTLPLYSGLQKIEVSNWAAGMYTVFIKRTGAVIATSKFVKQ